MVVSVTSQMTVEVTAVGVGEMPSPPAESCPMYLNPSNIVYVSPAMDDANYGCIIKLVDVESIIFIKEGASTVLSRMDRALRYLNMPPAGYGT